MDFWAALLVVFRRWYVFLPVFLITLVGAGAVFVSVPKVYTSTAVLMVTGPVNGGAVARNAPKTNPMLGFTQASRVTATLLVESLNTAGVADELGARPGSGTAVRVLNGAGNTELLDTGPYLQIVAETTTPLRAHELSTRMVEIADEHLLALQQAVGAPKNTYLTLSPAVSPTMPQADLTGRGRAAISALALGLMASLACAFAVESLAERRRRRRSAISDPPTSRAPSDARDLVDVGSTISPERPR
jgi:hypothetical protein